MGGLIEGIQYELNTFNFINSFTPLLTLIFMIKWREQHLSKSRLSRLLISVTYNTIKVTHKNKYFDFPWHRARVSVLKIKQHL